MQGGAYLRDSTEHVNTPNILRQLPHAKVLCNNYDNVMQLNN